MNYSVKTKLDVMAYERDGYQCVECGRATGIEAHHIEPEVEEIANLTTLCHSCHKKRHEMAGCFTSEDSRRNHEVVAKGHPFYGNQHTQ